jgi:uncharacterized membrane protein
MSQASSIFASEPINKGRQLELDVLKGLAILFMLLVHCLEALSEWPPEPSIPVRIIEFLGSAPAAPVFMFALGVGIVYSRRSTARGLFSRGLQLLIFAYVLAFFRDFLTEYAWYLRTGDEAYIESGITYLLGVDILQFAGLTFLFFSLGAKLKFGSLHYVVAAMLSAGANLLAPYIQAESAAANALVGLFWGTSEYTWFPFFTWIIYPIAGYVFGGYLIRCSDKRRFYQACLAVGIPALVLFRLYAQLQGLAFGWYTTEYWHHDLVGNLALVAFAVSWTGIGFFLAGALPQWVTNTLIRWSRNITTMYCCHWMILTWSAVFIGEPLSLPWILVFFIVLVPIRDYGTVRYLSIKERVLERFQSSRRGRPAAV